ncbi:hypothetical protein BC829DRAFT_406217 [Chytridium lagenaria]|nr:hypothetical protein BC829DRAFT_406217 [Chytridium lagenaria]
MFGTSDTAGARIAPPSHTPPTAYPLELFTLLPFLIIETTRLFLGTRGNKLEHKPSILIFLGLTIATVFLHLFYCIWQTYV